MAYPSTSDVRLGVVFGASNELTGTLKVPTAAQVEYGIGFGANGTEYTGELSTYGGGAKGAAPPISPG